MQNTKLRRRLMLIIAVPVILVMLYIGGLLGQLISGYRHWLAQDGMAGGVQMEAVILEPLYCLGKAFTGDGLMSMLIVSGAAAVLFVYLKLQNRFGSNVSVTQFCTVYRFPDERLQIV